MSTAITYSQLSHPYIHNQCYSCHMSTAFHTIHTVCLVAVIRMLHLSHSTYVLHLLFQTDSFTVTIPLLLGDHARQVLSPPPLHPALSPPPLHPDLSPPWPSHSRLGCPPMIAQCSLPMKTAFDSGETHSV